MLSSPQSLSHSRGVTLAETLVGLAVGLFVLTGAITMFVTTARYNSVTLSAAHLDQELRSAMSLMAHDLRRAGYSAIRAGQNTNMDGWIDINDMILNPFNAGVVDIRTGSFGSEAANSCVTYAYNLDEEAGETATVSGTTIPKPPTIGVCSGCSDSDLPSAFKNSPTYSPTNLPFDRDNIEMFGFRLNDGTLQMRTGLGGATTFDCNSGDWEGYTNDAVEITQLNFALTQTQLEVAQADLDDGDSNCQDTLPCVCIRDVDITITGRLASQTDVQQTLRERVRVRNDKFVAAFDATNPCRD